MCFRLKQAICRASASCCSWAAATTAGPRAEKCEALARTLEERTGRPVTLWDERRTTVAAHNILHQSGKKSKKHRESVDAVAASLILQGYLDFRRRQQQAGGRREE